MLHVIFILAVMKKTCFIIIKNKVLHRLTKIQASQVSICFKWEYF